MTVGVHPLAGFDKLLHYRVPEPLRSSVAVGSLVRMPILRELRLGVVGEIGSPRDFPPEKLRSIVEVVYPFPALAPDLLGLARWMSVYYASPMDAVIEAMIPAAVRRGAGIRTSTLVSLAVAIPPEEMAKLEKRAPQQARLAAFLSRQMAPQPKGLVLRRLGVPPAAAAALVKKGFLREDTRRVVREAYEDEWTAGEIVPPRPVELNPEQREAASSLEAGMGGGGFGVSLLHGVTGSGKTEVYFHAMECALRAGRGVVYLVPEVALTPQTVSRLRARLAAVAPGLKCIVWHSHLSDGERLDGWLALATGEARVVVGARSAVFAPVRDLGLVIVDEEHEPAYKQDESPRYQGRDVAVMRAKIAGARCVLGSATPSLESFLNASAGKYGLLRLRRRVDGRKLPHMTIVDMRLETARQREFSALSRPLVDAMQARFERREQTILFINRRGYASSMLCRRCGRVEECEHCSVTMTYHRVDETLRCHLCGAQRPAPVRCAGCGAPDVRWRGLGTQRVEEATRRVLPRARIVRIDTDTMARKNRFREILTDFRLGKIDVLVGTQMIGKGLDFPNVTLVGLVDADLSMHVPDFRANERTFQLLVQVAGRAGRGDRSGDVVVQTFTPQAGPVQFSRHADYDGFAEAELALRREFRYPPYRHLIHHLLRGPNPEKLRFFAGQWAKSVKEELGARLEVRGPAPSPVEKIKDQYRWQLWYFTDSVTRTIGDLSLLRERFAWPDDLVQVLDVDPANLV
jgi:primosomal protein N' (replication factor Y) (superfamily II helicase)